MADETGTRRVAAALAALGVGLAPIGEAVAGEASLGLVDEGRGIGDLVLGRPATAEAVARIGRLLGRPPEFSDPRAYIAWGLGAHPAFAVHVRAGRIEALHCAVRGFHTVKGLDVGDPLPHARRLYPQAIRDLGSQGRPAGLLVYGPRTLLTILGAGDDVGGFLLERSTEAERLSAIRLGRRLPGNAGTRLADLAAAVFPTSRREILPLTPPDAFALIRVWPPGGGPGFLAATQERVSGTSPARRPVLVREF